MGYMSVIAECCSCRRMFSCNHRFVPAIRDRAGEKQPLCRGCVEGANVQRKAKGLPEFPIHPQAYEPEEVP